MEPKTRITHTYMLWRPSGEWHTWRLPTAFDVHDVQAKAPHSDVWMYVPKGYRVYARHNEAFSGFFTGPLWAYWDPSQNEFTRRAYDRPSKVGMKFHLQSVRVGVLPA